MGRRQFGAGYGKATALAARAEDHAIGMHPHSAVSLDGMRIDKARVPRPLVERYPQAVNLLAKRGMLARVVDHLTHSGE